MKRFCASFLVVLMVFVMAMPAFAADAPEEPSEPEIEISEEPSEPEPEEPSEPDPSEPESEEPSEPSESSGGDFLGGSTMISLDGATVNVSDQSVQAIADAVVNATYTFKYQYEFTTSEGKTVVIDTDVPNLFEDYHLVYLSSTLLLSSEPIIVKNDDIATRFFRDDGLSFKRLSAKSLYSSADISTSGASTTQHNYTTVLWSNKHVYNVTTGDLLYESPYLPPLEFTVSFNTGFDDLVVDDVLSSDFDGAPILMMPGYRFDGWYLDEACTIRFRDGSTEFTADTTLYAGWTPYRTVTFDTGIEDFVLDGITILSGDAYYPSDFSYPGYEFVGAYTDPEFQNQFVGGTVVDEDITLYLRFEPIVYDFGALISETNTLLTAILFLNCIWTAAYVWKSLIGR